MLNYQRVQSGMHIQEDSSNGSGSKVQYQPAQKMVPFRPEHTKTMHVCRTPQYMMWRFPKIVVPLNHPF